MACKNEQTDVRTSQQENKHRQIIKCNLDIIQLLPTFFLIPIGLADIYWQDFLHHSS